MYSVHVQEKVYDKVSFLLCILLIVQLKYNVMICAELDNVYYV